LQENNIEKKSKKRSNVGYGAITNQFGNITQVNYKEDVGKDIHGALDVV
jgi:hypothetical protein